MLYKTCDVFHFSSLILHSSVVYTGFGLVHTSTVFHAKVILWPGNEASDILQGRWGSEASCSLNNAI